MAGLCAVHEQPILPADRHRLQAAFRDVVVDREITDLEVTVGRRPLITGIRRRLANQAL